MCASVVAAPFLSLAFRVIILMCFVSLCMSPDYGAPFAFWCSQTPVTTIHSKTATIRSSLMRLSNSCVWNETYQMLPLKRICAVSMQPFSHNSSEKCCNQHLNHSIRFARSVCQFLNPCSGCCDFFRMFL